MEYLSKNSSSTHKILFTGLDAAGKTSIIEALRRQFSKIAKIEPTRGADRKFFKILGREISEWDLGGQISYRISYLKNPSKFFDGTETTIYVIDIQDGARISESIGYLSDVIQQFQKLRIDPPINILFHKCDPAILRNNKDAITSITSNIIKEIRKLVNYKKIYYFHTSIYDLYTIMNAMSKILLDLLPKSQLIDKTVEEFTKKLNCEGLMIIDDNSLIIGSYFENETSKLFLNKSVGYFLTLDDSFLEIGLGQEEDQILVRKLGKYFLFKQIRFQNSTSPFYLLLIKGYNPFDIFFLKKELAVFVAHLNDLIYS